MIDLTERERKVLVLRSRGESFKQIAVGLGVSPNTVGVFQFRAWRKIGAHSRADAADYVNKHLLAAA